MNIKIESKDILKALSKGWQKAHISVFFALLLLAIAFTIYIWQRSLGGSGWNDEKKQNFLQSLNSGARLNEKEYQQALSDFTKRKDSQGAQQTRLRDIFKEN